LYHFPVFEWSKSSLSITDSEIKGNYRTHSPFLM